MQIIRPVCQKNGGHNIENKGHTTCHKMGSDTKTWEPIILGNETIKQNMNPVYRQIEPV